MKIKLCIGTEHCKMMGLKEEIIYFIFIFFSKYQVIYKTRSTITPILLSMFNIKVIKRNPLPQTVAPTTLPTSFGSCHFVAPANSTTLYKIP